MRKALLTAVLILLVFTVSCMSQNESINPSPESTQKTAVKTKTPGKSPKDGGKTQAETPTQTPAESPTPAPIETPPAKPTPQVKKVDIHIIEAYIKSKAPSNIQFVSVKFSPVHHKFTIDAVALADKGKPPLQAISLFLRNLQRGGQYIDSKGLTLTRTRRMPRGKTPGFSFRLEAAVDRKVKVEMPLEEGKIINNSGATTSDDHKRLIESLKPEVVKIKSIRKKHGDIILDAVAYEKELVNGGGAPLIYANALRKTNQYSVRFTNVRRINKDNRTTIQFRLKIKTIKK